MDGGGDNELDVGRNGSERGAVMAREWEAKTERESSACPHARIWSQRHVVWWSVGGEWWE
jgi:hypothetical protein